MVATEHQSDAVEDAGTRAQRWFNRALFPVSAGAVAAEIGYVLVTFFSLERHLGIWAGIVGGGAAFMFQQMTPRKQ